jgi:hypothetical protein
MGCPWNRLKEDPGVTEEVWSICTEPGTMLHSLDGKGSERKLRLFGSACCRRISEFIPEERIKRLIGLNEEFADNRLDQSQYLAAWHQAADAYRKFDNSLGTKSYAYAMGAVLGLGVRLDLVAVTNEIAELITQVLSPLFAVIEQEHQAHLLRDIIGNPYQQQMLDRAWRTSTVLALASQVYETRDFSPLPILADALQDAGCDDEMILSHCRNPEQIHVRGCWLVDLLTYRE